MWVGYSDREREGTWRFINGELYDANNRGQSAVAYWGDGEPNSNANDGYDQDCAKLWRRYGPFELDDINCDYSYYAICEIKTNKCLS